MRMTAKEIRWIITALATCMSAAINRDALAADKSPTTGCADRELGIRHFGGQARIFRATTLANRPQPS